MYVLCFLQQCKHYAHMCLCSCIIDKNGVLVDKNGVLMPTAQSHTMLTVQHFSNNCLQIIACSRYGKGSIQLICESQTSVSC